MVFFNKGQNDWDKIWVKKSNSELTCSVWKLRGFLFLLPSPDFPPEELLNLKISVHEHSSVTAKKNLSIPIILIDEKELYNDQKTYSWGLYFQQHLNDVLHILWSYIFYHGLLYSQRFCWLVCFCATTCTLSQNRSKDGEEWVSQEEPGGCFLKASKKAGYELLQERQKSLLLPGVLWLSWSQISRVRRHPICFVTP